MAPLLLSGTDSHFQQKLQGIKGIKADTGFKNRTGGTEPEQSERDGQGIICSDPGMQYYFN
jgi:hypothetical protein